MALYDDPKKKRPLTALEQQAAATQADYGASVDRMQTAQKQATGIQIPMPIIQEGRGSFKSIARPGQDAAVTALGALGGVVRQEQAKQAAMIPTFQAQAAGLRQQAGADRATAANLGANKLLANVGAAPIAAPLATPRPAVQPATAAIASPGVRFAGIDAAPDNFYRNPPGTNPRSAAELDQASKAETAARNQASLPGASAGAGASTTAGAGAPITKSVGKFGETVYSNVGSQPGTPATAGTMGTVNTQNFGNPVVPQAPGSIARPGVASTFGLGVNDPRLQAPSISRPGQLTLNPNGNAETFNARQDREASKALASDLGTEAFMLRGKTDPASLRALAEVAQTRAGLLSGTEGLSAAAIQGTANRDNQFGIADLNNAGENNRAGIQADVARGAQQVTREGQQINADVERAKIARPELRQDANGNYVNISGNTGTPVVDAAGNPVRGQQTQTQQRDYSKEADDKLIADLLDMQRDPMTGALAPNAVQAAQQQFQQLRGAQNPQPAAPAGMKQVGTSGGKPVYEDAKGNRFTL